jgi:acetyl-CoA carboxylase alpha subunit
VLDNLAVLKKINLDTLLQQRYDKFAAMGRF